MRNNSVGTKVIKFLLWFILFATVSVLLSPILFGIFGPMVRALPFPTPSNFAVADFMGVLTLVLLGILSLYYAYKFGWR